MQSPRFSLLAAVLALVLAISAHAQETTAPAEEAPAPEAPATEAPAAEDPAAEDPAAEDPATGAPAAGAPAAPAPEAGTAPAGGVAPGDPAGPEIMEVVKAVFQDWEVRCAPEGNECFMYQLAHDTENNPVAEVSLLKLPEAADAAAGMTVVTPLGTLLPAGVAVQIDAGERSLHPFAWCSQVGCFSRFPLADDAIAAMKRGKAGKVTLVSIVAPNRPLTLDLSLAGFTAAYDSLEVPQLPAQAAPPAPAPLAPAPLAPAPSE